MSIRKRLHLYRCLNASRHRSTARCCANSGIDSLQRRKCGGDLENASIIIHNGAHSQKTRNFDLSITRKAKSNRSGRIFNGTYKRSGHLVLRIDELTVLAPEKRKVRGRDDVEEGQLIQLLHRFELEEFHKERVSFEEFPRVDLNDEARHAVIHPNSLIIDAVSTHSATHFLHGALVHFAAVAWEVLGSGSIAFRVHRVHYAWLIGGIDRDPSGPERGLTYLALEKVVVVFIRENFVLAANSVR